MQPEQLFPSIQVTLSSADWEFISSLLRAQTAKERDSLVYTALEIVCSKLNTELTKSKIYTGGVKG